MEGLPCPPTCSHSSSNHIGGNQRLLAITGNYWLGYRTPVLSKQNVMTDSWVGFDLSWWRGIELKQMGVGGEGEKTGYLLWSSSLPYGVVRALHPLACDLCVLYSTRSYGGSTDSSAVRLKQFYWSSDHAHRRSTQRERSVSTWFFVCKDLWCGLEGGSEGVSYRDKAMAWAVGLYVCVCVL
ncbi:unnamed protein product [Discosporangium mesarthrocarpum]